MNSQNSTNKVALVTGASSGMGKDFALALLKEGYVVYGAARRVEKMHEIEAAGGIALAMDITDEEQVNTAVQAIQEQHSGIDVLINNAGFGLYGAVEDIDIEKARYQFEVNLFGLARLTQLLLPGMRSKGAGKIINISSMGGKVYTPLGAWYHATKHALEGWSDCLRIELNSFGIDVVVIEPGAIDTEFGEVMIGPMIENSGKTAYATLVEKLSKSLIEAYEKQGASSTQVITDLMLKAVRAKQPQTRYVGGKFAKPMMFVRKWFGDRAYDRMVLSMIK